MPSSTEPRMENDNEPSAHPDQEAAASQPLETPQPQDSQEQPQAEAQASDAAAPVEGAAPAEPQLSEEERREQLKKALESLLFITDHPLPLQKLCKIVGVTQKESKRVVEAIGLLKQELDDKKSAVQVVEVADGFQMGTRPQFAPFVKKLFTEKMTMRLSTAAHETLSIIAYKQPLTRAEIEQIRGVEVIAAIETLLEKRLIEVVGRRETVGRPLLYGTTTDFLRHFGLRSLEDLPPIDSFTVENAPLGERGSAASAAETPSESAVADGVQSAGEAALSAEVPTTEAGLSEDLPAEGASKPLPSCVEAQSKEFAAGEEMAAEREQKEFDETGSAPVIEEGVSGDESPEAKPKKKTLWD